MIAELFLLVATAQAQPRTAACAAMKTFKLPGVALEITKADWVAAGSSPPPAGPGGPGPASPLKLPAYCLVEGPGGAAAGVGALGRRLGEVREVRGVGLEAALPRLLVGVCHEDPARAAVEGPRGSVEVRGVGRQRPLSLVNSGSDGSIKPFWLVSMYPRSGDCPMRRISPSP